jgi:GntR family transcriptional regulator/MocR family aminotransferase
MLESGELTRHTARARRIYADRRAVLRRELAELPRGYSLVGLDAGLHGVLRFPAGIPAEPLVAQAAGEGILLTSVAACSSRTPDVDGLVLGYAGATGTGLTRGLRVVRDLIGSH